MNYESFMKFLKQENIDKNIFLLYGEEVFLKQHAKKELLKRITPESMPEFNVFSYDDKKYDLKSVEEAIEALPVMSDKKLLLFRNSGIFAVNGKEAATKEYKEFWAEKLPEIPSDVFVVFDEEKVAKNSPLFKKLDKEDKTVEFSYLSENKMINWTIGLFKTMGKVINPHAAQYLVEITGEGMLSVKMEAEKVVSYTQDRIDVTKKDIDAVVVPVLENRVFEMVDAILAKNSYTALEKLKDLTAMKEDEIKILGAISSSVDKLLTVKLMSESRLDKAQIIQKSKIAPFLVNKYITLGAKYKKETLEALLTMCVETDRKFKNTPIDKTVLLERFVAGFATEK